MLVHEINKDRFLYTNCAVNGDYCPYWCEQKSQNIPSSTYVLNFHKKNMLGRIFLENQVIGPFLYSRQCNGNFCNSLSHCTKRNRILL